MTKRKSASISTAEWITKAQGVKRKCCACLDKTNASLQELLKQINAAKAFKISVPAMYDRMCQLHKGYADRVGYASFRSHLANHEPLWHRSKAKQ